MANPCGCRLTNSFIRAARTSAGTTPSFPGADMITGEVRRQEARHYGLLIRRGSELQRRTKSG